MLLRAQLLRGHGDAKFRLLDTDADSRKLGKRLSHLIDDQRGETSGGPDRGVFRGDRADSVEVTEGAAIEPEVGMRKLTGTQRVETETRQPASARRRNLILGLLDF